MVNDERELPPISEVAVAVMILVIIGGVYIAGKLPQHVPLGLPLALLLVSAVLLLVNVYLLSTLKDFAWDYFFLVAKWALLAYIVIAGMLEYIFLYDNTPGKIMAILTGMLAIYAVNIPMLFAFSVARYQEPRSSRQA